MCVNLTISYAFGKGRNEAIFMSALLNMWFHVVKLKPESVSSNIQRLHTPISLDSWILWVAITCFKSKRLFVNVDVLVANIFPEDNNCWCDASIIAEVLQRWCQY